MNKYTAEQDAAATEVKGLLADIQKIYDRIEGIAKVHQIDVRYYGPDGEGDNGWYDHDEGRWMSSAGSC